jgi:hypothetical protein
LTCYYGDIHGHTGYSDGYGLPAEYFARAMDEQKLDFAAISDHAEIMLNFEEAFPKESPDTPSLWESTIEALEAAYAPGQFVTLAGFEWTSKTYGHRNVYFRDVVHLPQSPLSSNVFLSPEDLWQELDRQACQAFTIPHHPGRLTHRVDWSFSHERERLVEIYSKWGNSESLSSDYESFIFYLVIPFLKIFMINRFVSGALLNGHKLGIIAASDTHQGLAGSVQRNEPRGNSLKEIHGVQNDSELLNKLKELGVTFEEYLDLIARGFTWDHRRPIGAGGGLCAVWADNLVREEIWDAMWDRTTFGTSGIRPEVQFVLRDSNDHEHFTLMGGEIAVTGKPELLVNVKADDSSHISRVQLTRRGIPLADEPFMEKQVSFKVMDVGHTPQQSSVFYALKIEFVQDSEHNFDNDQVLIFEDGKFQFDGSQLAERVWVSPIWINQEA